MLESYLMSWPLSLMCPPSQLEMQDEENFKTAFKVNLLLNNRLSLFWKEEYRHDNPAVIYAYPVFYVAGMVGYAVALPFRVLGFIFDLLKLIGTCLIYPFTQNPSSVKEAAEVAGYSALELGSNMVGVFVPVLAYQWDEWIHDQKHYHDNTWFSYHMQEALTLPAGWKKEMVDRLPKKYPTLASAFEESKEKLKGYKIDSVDHILIADKVAVILLVEKKDRSIMQAFSWKDPSAVGGILKELETTWEMLAKHVPSDMLWNSVIEDLMEGLTNNNYSTQPLSPDKKGLLLQFILNVTGLTEQTTGLFRQEALPFQKHYVD